MQNHYFRKEFLDDTFFTLSVLSRASDNTTSQNIGGRMHGPSPHLNFLGDRLPRPPRSPPLPCHVKRSVFNLSSGRIFHVGPAWPCNYRSLGLSINYHLATITFHVRLKRVSRHLLCHLSCSLFLTHFSPTSLYIIFKACYACKLLRN